MKFLFKIESTFSLPQGAGLVIAPGVFQKGPPTRVKDQIQLRTPDGRVIDTYVDAIAISDPPLIEGRLSIPEHTPIKLPRGISEQEVPNGTEVWLVTEQQP